MKEVSSLRKADTLGSEVGLERGTKTRYQIFPNEVPRLAGGKRSEMSRNEFRC
jgi:hypothetical protein